MIPGALGVSCCLQGPIKARPLSSANLVLMIDRSVFVVRIIRTVGGMIDDNGLVYG